MKEVGRELGGIWSKDPKAGACWRVGRATRLPALWKKEETGEGIAAYGSSDLWPRCLPLMLTQFFYGEFSCIPACLVAQLVKNPPCNAGDLCSIPGSGRSPGEGKDYLLQPGEFHGLYRPWVAKSRARLRDFHFTSCILFVNIWLWH